MGASVRISCLRELINTATDINMNKLLLVGCLIGGTMAFPYPFPQGGPQGGGAPGPLPIPGEDGYFQYINVPAHKQYEWGYRRGNDGHNREQYLSQKDHTFKSKLKWHDAYGGHGEHYFDFNHGGGYEEPKYQEPPKYVPTAPPVYSS